MTRPKLSSIALASADDVQSEFYEALRHGDLERLMALWSDDDEVSCVHPGGPRLIGSDAIRSSFESIFSRGPVQARPEQIRRLQTHACEVHCLLERVQVPADSGVQDAWVVATNVYVATALGWRIAAHHASPGVPGSAAAFAEAAAVLH